MKAAALHGMSEFLEEYFSVYLVSLVICFKLIVTVYISYIRKKKIDM